MDESQKQKQPTTKKIKSTSAGTGTSSSHSTQKRNAGDGDGSQHWIFQSQHTTGGGKRGRKSSSDGKSTLASTTAKTAASKIMQQPSDGKSKDVISDGKSPHSSTTANATTAATAATATTATAAAKNQSSSAVPTFEVIDSFIPTNKPFSAHSQMHLNAAGTSVTIFGSQINIPATWEGRIDSNSGDGFKLIIMHTMMKVAVVVDDINKFNPRGGSINDEDNKKTYDQTNEFVVFVERGGTFQKMTCYMNSDIDFEVDVVENGRGKMISVARLLDVNSSLSSPVKMEDGCEHLSGVVCVNGLYSLRGFHRPTENLLTMKGADILQWLSNINGIKEQYNQTQTQQTPTQQTQTQQEVAAQNSSEGDDVGKGKAADAGSKVSPILIDDGNDGLVDPVPLKPDAQHNPHLCYQCIGATEKKGTACSNCDKNFCDSCKVSCLVNKSKECYCCIDTDVVLNDGMTVHKLSGERAKASELASLSRLIPNDPVALAQKLPNKKGLELLLKKCTDIMFGLQQVHQKKESTYTACIRTSVHSQEIDLVVILLMIGNVLRQCHMSIERIKDLLRDYFLALPGTHSTKMLYNLVQTTVNTICENLDATESRSLFGIRQESKGLAKGGITFVDEQGTTVDLSKRHGLIPAFFEAYAYGGCPSHDPKITISKDTKVIIQVEKYSFVTCLDDSTVSEKGKMAKKAAEKAIWVTSGGQHNVASLGFFKAIYQKARHLRVMGCGDMNVYGYRIIGSVYEKVNVPIELLLVHQDMLTKYGIDEEDGALDDDEKKELTSFIQTSKWLDQHPICKAKVEKSKGFVNMEVLYNSENGHDMTRIILDEMKGQFDIDLY